MRKEVNRSLLVWPAAASAAIIAGIWFHPSDTRRASHRWAVEIASGAVLEQLESLGRGLGLSRGERSETAEPISFEGRSPERIASGGRAMQLPARLASVFGVSEETGALRAPRIDERRELAGLSARPVGPWQRDSQADGHGPRPAAAPIPLTSQTADRKRGSSDNPPILGSPDSPTLVLTLAAPVVADRDRDAKRSADGRQNGSADGVLDDRAGSAVSAASVRGGVPAKAAAHAVAGGDPRTPSSPSLRAAGSGRAAVLRRDRAAVSGRAASPRSVTKGPAAWPSVDRLRKQLQVLNRRSDKEGRPKSPRLVSSTSSRPVTAASLSDQWAEDVQSRLAKLDSLSRLADEEAGELIDQLARDAKAGLRLGEATTDRQRQIDWLLASHALARRTAVWKPIWKVADNPGGVRRGGRPSADPRRIRSYVRRIRGELPETGDREGWGRYLMLDEIVEASKLGANSAESRLEQRSLLAQRFLSRIRWHGLAPTHREWLRRDSIRQLADALRPWSWTPVDYARLLDQLERRESDYIDLAAIDIADAVQTLRFAETEEARRVADAIDTYYRNANVRVAISEQMIERLIPPVEPQTLPIRRRLFGSQIRGVSRVETDVDIRFKPAPDRWLLELSTAGEVHTRSVGRNGAVSVRTAGQSAFNSATPIEVTEHRVRVGDSTVNVSGTNRLRGIRSDFDGWPLIGTLARSIAAKRYEELAPRSRRYSNREIRREVVEGIDRRVDAEIDRATKRFSEAVIGPLGKLRLDPMVVDMQTTENRLIARYRLAGDWQLAAFTPRPRAPRTSLMSVQIHQSAINNTLEQLAPRDRSESIRAIFEKTFELFELKDPALPDEIPEDATVRFAPTRPITVEIEDGRLWVTLRIIRLRRGDRLDLSRFIVRAAYRPERRDLTARLVRDGHLRVDGPAMSMRERLPVRAIFNKVLSPNRAIPLTPEKLIEHPAAHDLAVSQFELRDGWIGLAVSLDDAPRIAVERSAVTAR